ncbi:unnamed protein product [Paramecium pentaurelia]|uniref:3'(2'),5'-bisphosphate nucleotidase n=1 Tax=Paramecium pentaurelia TaxID=43138 RepID=A0A8S1XVZ8_9CILI|nr:unnamed protein product [Paramecium pentaurelia]
MLKVHEFFSVATQLAYNAAIIINQIRLSADIGQKWKGIDDPVTIADVKAQTYIIQQLHKHWPQLKIVGEETTVYDQPIDLPDTNCNLYTEDIFTTTPNNLKVRTQYEIEDLCVWVDPLDGTLDFVQGDFDCVTTLIGLSYKKKALMGIISQPFVKIADKQYEFKPKIYFGHHPQRRVFYTYDTQSQIPFELLKPSYNPSNIVLCTQNKRIDETKLEKIKSLGCSLLQMGGSGKKSLTILESKADLYLYLGIRMSKWDICAPDALFQAFGGRFVGLEGQIYEYNSEDKIYDNPYGHLASIHNELVDKFLPKTTGML